MSTRVAGRSALPEAPPDGLILSVLLFDTGCSALCEAAREEAGCAALPGALLDTGRSALFEAAREEAGRFIAAVTLDAAKTLEPHVRTISCMQDNNTETTYKIRYDIVYKIRYKISYKIRDIR